MTTNQSILCIFLCGLTSISQAIEPITGEMELGIIATSGNTQTSAVKSKLSVTQDFEKWKNTYLIDTLLKEEKVAINGVKSTQTSAERYLASAQADYKLNEKHSALFIYGSYENDRFAGFNQQDSLAVGYTDQLFANENSLLSYSAGPGYFYKELNDTSTEEGGIFRLALDYQNALSPTAKFKQLISTEAALESDDNTKTKSETSISATLMGNLSLKASYNLIHNSKVQSGIEKLDSTTSLSVLYLF